MKKETAGIFALGTIAASLAFAVVNSTADETGMSDAKGCLDRILDAASRKAQEDNATVSLKGDELKILKDACLKKFPGTSLGYYEHMNEMTVSPPAPLGVPSNKPQSSPA